MHSKLQLPLGLLYIFPWFHINLPKTTCTIEAGCKLLADKEYKVEAIVKLSKGKTHAKLHWLGYDLTFVKWIPL